MGFVTSHTSVAPSWMRSSMIDMSIRFPLIPKGLAFSAKRRGLAAFTASDSGIAGTTARLGGIARTASGRAAPIAPDTAPFDQTVIIGPGMKPPMPGKSIVEMGGRPTPRLVETTRNGEQVFELKNSICVLGKDEQADIEIGGMFIARQHAEIVQENGDYVIRHMNGRRRVTVDGKKIRVCTLKDNDAIRIGKREFIFQE